MPYAFCIHISYPVFSFALEHSLLTVLQPVALVKAYNAFKILRWTNLYILLSSGFFRSKVGEQCSGLLSLRCGCGEGAWGRDSGAS